MSETSAPAHTPRTVLVTGASRGIGRAIAERFLALGDRVATISLGDDVPDGVLSVRGDVTSTTDVDAGFTLVEKELGPVEVLVANAGITRDGLLMRMSDEDFATVIDVNLAGAFRCARRASKGMIKMRRGRMIFISSVVAMLGGAGQANYGSSKAGLVGLARSITRELGGRGITANVVAPGFVRTAMTDALPAEQQQTYLTQIPSGRYAEADEIAGVVQFLAGPDAAYVSGAIVPVDGGLGMGH